MDDYDDARYIQGPGPLGEEPSRHSRPGPGPRRAAGTHRMVLRQGVDCREELLEQQGRDGTIRVHALTPAGHDAVRAEMHLLASLEVAGVTAAPCVLTIEERGYVREGAPPLDRRSGRRAAESGSPATAERVALGRARDHLDALVDALHERGWLLGATPGEGIGRRSDGSVVLLDLSGLRPGEELTVRQADRRWVDSVLQDQERTLRRRLHHPHGPAPSDGSGSALPATPERSDVRADFSGIGTMATTDPDGQGIQLADEEDHDVTHVAVAAPPVPPPSIFRLRRARSARAGELVPHSGAVPAAPLDVIREVLSSPGNRRTAIMTAGTVLLVGAVIGAGAWLVTPSSPPQEPGATAAATSPASDAPAPTITDPWALAAELAGSRHAYVTGLSTQPVAAPGSPAFAADEVVRAAYTDLTIEGGGPVIHEASVVEGSSSDGTALLQVTTSTESYEVFEADGATRVVHATEPTVVELALAWDGDHWLVQTTRTMTDASAS
ncbi:hypothetical protein [Brachybacterium sp. FME24]|uniref:hypothetical protein n=1 Tax=Brachybacterium sp. FME24 TaxID=2742605 RepID=UPI00186918E8|nr:hypothetical protein [Brachybacterium sp. FME24]